MKGKNTLKLSLACGSAHVQLACAGRRGERGRHLFCGVILMAFLAFAGSSGLPGPALGAENTGVSTKRSSQRLNFADDEIANGFFKVAFGAELQFGRLAMRIRKFDEPVRVFIDNRSVPGRSAEILAAVSDIRAHVARLDIAATEDRDVANVIVTVVRQEEFSRTLRARFGTEKARKITRSLRPVCLTGIGKDHTFRIRRAEIFLPGNVDDFTFSDCVYEELLQALGPINDTASVPWTMFNDNVQMGFFDRYDQYLLNVLYHPRVAPGMTEDEVRSLFPEIMPEVRATVSRLETATKTQQSFLTEEAIILGLALGLRSNILFPIHCYSNSSRVSVALTKLRPAAAHRPSCPSQMGHKENGRPAPLNRVHLSSSAVSCSLHLLNHSVNAVTHGTSSPRLLHRAPNSNYVCSDFGDRAASICTEDRARQG
jgi:Protein of unknown function (DUF2927)